jgi:hypothetical protein
VSESETVVNNSEEDKEEEVVVQEAMQQVQHNLSSYLASETNSDSGVASLDRTPEDATATTSSSNQWTDRPQGIVVTPAERFNYSGNWNNMIQSQARQLKKSKKPSPRGSRKSPRRDVAAPFERSKALNGHFQTNSR